jgi:hypothetical protein
MNKTTQNIALNQVTSGEFVNRIQNSIQKSKESGRPFAILLIQIPQLNQMKIQRPVVARALEKELYQTIRNAVHPHQFVGIYQHGLGLVFDMMDVGNIDVLGKKLLLLSQYVVRNGKYNDISGRWTDIVYKFLFPQSPDLIQSKIGWAIAPRDGGTPRDLIKRAYHHIAELSR